MKKILFRGPLLTRSGYGEQARFAMRALRSRPDLFDIYIQPLSWGQTSWMTEEDEERKWVDATIEKTIGYVHQGGQFDASFQVTIPNEWERIAPVNIGFTAGMETTRVAPQWLEKGNQMERIIVVSNHAKRTYANTTYMAKTAEGQESELRLHTPIEAVNYPVKDFGESEELPLSLDYDVNFVVMAQMGPRKNIPNTVRWFVEEFHDEEVGLVLKANMAKNCVMDREKLYGDIKSFLRGKEDRKCKVYLLHGDMTDKEVHSLFVHPKIRALLTLSHGEGFGLPIFECAYSGVPVVAPGWSGQLDFLVDKSTGEDYFYNVEYDIQPIPQSIVWDGVIVKESMWAIPREHSAKQQMRRCYSDLTTGKDNPAATMSQTNAARLHVEFTEEKQNAQMVAEVCTALCLDPDQTSGTEVLEFE